MKKIETLWEYIQYLYKKNYNIPPKIVDSMGVLDILEMCAGGLANETIARNLELPVSYIDDVIFEYLRFSGWEQDLDISPLMVYDSLDGSYSYYKTTIGTVSSVTTRELINKSFRICKTYNDIRKEINRYVK